MINDTLELCKEKFNYNSVTIKVNCPPDLTFECRAAQISQILMNLLTNAFDAINTLNEKWIEINVSDDTHNIIFCVTDSGHGIESKIAKKIMQPFYTTKEFGKGTGLGLVFQTVLQKRIMDICSTSPIQKTQHLCSLSPKFIFTISNKPLNRI